MTSGPGDPALLGPGIWIPLRGEEHPPDQLIGHRRCAGCGQELFAHCEVREHVIPCCPGRCPGPPRGRGGRHGGGRPRRTP